MRRPSGPASSDEANLGITSMGDDDGDHDDDKLLVNFYLLVVLTAANNFAAG